MALDPNMNDEPPNIQVAPIGDYWVYRLIWGEYSIQSEGFLFDSKADAQKAAFERMATEIMNTQTDSTIYDWQDVDETAQI